MGRGLVCICNQRFREVALRGDSSYHPLLAECFASSSVFPPDWTPDRWRPPDPIQPAWAVWCLRNNLLFLSKLLSARPTKETSTAPPQHTTDYSGLSGSLKKTMKGLIESSSEVGSHLDNRSRLLKNLDRFFLCVLDALEADGIAGWVACRCASTLMEAKEAGIYGPYRYAEPDGSMYWFAGRGGSLGIDKLDGWRRLRRAVGEFYRAAGTTNLRRLVGEGFLAAPPDQVRVGSALGQ